MVFAQFQAATTLDYGEYPTVDHFVTTIKGRLYTYNEQEKKQTIGQIRAWKLHLELMEEAAQDPWEVMDAESGELEALFSALFDVRTRELKPAALMAAELQLPPDHVFAIHTIEIEESQRGKRLSLQLISRAMEIYSGRAGIAALFPYPLGMRGEERHRVKRAQRKLSMYWQSAGFSPIRGSDWLICNGARGIR